jgi:hypothetical protein
VSFTTDRVASLGSAAAPEMCGPISNLLPDDHDNKGRLPLPSITTRGSFGSKPMVHNIASIALCRSLLIIFTDPGRHCHAKCTQYFYASYFQEIYTNDVAGRDSRERRCPLGAAVKNCELHSRISQVTTGFYRSAFNVTYDSGRY